MTGDQHLRHAFEQLGGFLGEVFTGDELRRWLSTLSPGGVSLRGELPGETATLNQLVFDGLAALHRRAAIDAAFWDSLVGQRPGFARQIRVIRALFAMPPWPDADELAALCRELGLADATPPLALAGDPALYWLLYTAIHRRTQDRLAGLLRACQEFPCSADFRQSLQRALDPGAALGGVSVHVQTAPARPSQGAAAVQTWTLEPDGALTGARAEVGPNDATHVDLGAEMSLKLKIEDGRLELLVTGSSRSSLRGAKIRVWQGLRNVVRTLIPRFGDEQLGSGRITYFAASLELSEDVPHGNT